MAPEKRNTFLDAGDSEEEDDHYDSEAEDVQKGGRGTKRRREDEDDDDNDDDLSSDDGADIEIDDRFKFDEEDAVTVSKSKTTKTTTTDKDSSRIKKKGKETKRAKRDEEEEEVEVVEEVDEDANDSDRPQKDKKINKLPKDSSANDGDISRIELPGVNKPLTKKNLVASQKAVRRSGVVYLSRIPPFMKPTKLRSLLSPYGAINRIFLSPEDPLSHTRRVRGGGNKKRSFVDGWVEFVNKADAQRAVDLLNAQTIGGKKGTYYRDDLWTLVYLRGFKWHHLTEQIATENAERAGRMRAELEQTARENKAFLENVEQAKILDGMEAKAAAKAKRATGGAEGASTTTEAPAKAPTSQKASRSFKQKKMVARADEGEQSEHVQRVLSKIF